jgi:DNA-binding transcriptional MocR family regulator
LVKLCNKRLGNWITVSRNDSGMQVTGIKPFDDREVAATTLKHGIHGEPLSINFHDDSPRHRLLLGFVALGRARDTNHGEGMGATFEDLQRRL